MDSETVVRVALHKAWEVLQLGQRLLMLDQLSSIPDQLIVTSAGRLTVLRAEPPPTSPGQQATARPAEEVKI